MKKIVLLIICTLSLLSVGFAQWQPANNGFSGEDINVITVDTLTNYIYAGTDGGGVYMSTDNGSNWTAVNNGLSGDGLDVNSIAISGSNIFAGTWGGGVFLSTNNGSTWAAVNNGLPSNNLYFRSIAINESNIFTGTRIGGVYMSTDNGSNWTAVNNGLSGQGLDVNSITISGSNIFAGTEGGVFLSTNNGSTWTAVNNGLSFMGSYVNSIAISGDNIFAGTLGGVFLSTNNGNSWTAVNNGLCPDGYNMEYIESLAISGNNIFAGTTYDGVFLSTNSGSSWIAVNNGLSGDGLDVNSIAISGSNIFAGTGRDISTGTDGNGVWKRLLTDIGNITVSTNSLTIDDSSNSSGTFNITSNTNWTVSSSETWLTASPNSGSGNVTITLTASANAATSSRKAIVTVSGTEVASQTIKVSQYGVGPWQQDGLIAYYPFNGNADDESGNGNDGTVNGATLTTDRFGNLNTAYNFNGVDNNIVVDYQYGNQYESEYTVAMWVHADSEQELYAKLLCFPQQSDSWEDPYHNLAINYYNPESGIQQFDIGYFNDIGFSGNVFTNEVYPDKWQNLVFTFDNGEMRLYVDSELMKVGSLPETQLFFPNHGFSIGSHSTTPSFDGEFFHGIIDDIRIYNRRLDELEITSLFFGSNVCTETVYDTTFTTVYDTIYTTINDTTFTTVFDTIHISVSDTTFITIYDSIAVTDTLIIDAVLTGVYPPDNHNTLKIYPNPTKDFMIINTGDYSSMQDYTIKIINMVGTTVFETDIQEPEYSINLSTWTGKGVYLVKIFDNTSQEISVKKIVLQ